MTKIAYCRVSSSDQNLERQIEAVTAYGCQIIYQEKKSGKNTARPELNAMLASLTNEDTVVVLTLDRLGRSLGDLINITKRINEVGAAFVSIKQSIDTSTATGRLFFNILGSIAEFEREMILERQKDGIRVAKASGKTWGRSCKITDIDKVKIDVASGLTIYDMCTKYKVNKVTMWRTLKRYDLFDVYRERQKITDEETNPA